MAKSKRARPGHGARNGQHSKQQNKKSAPSRRSRAYSQTSDYEHATFTLNDAARATDSKRNYTSASGISLRHMAMNFVRGNESAEQDSDHDIYASSLQREIDISEPTLKNHPTGAPTASAIEHHELTAAVIQEENRPAEESNILHDAPYSQIYVRHSRSPSSSSDEVVFIGRNNMRHPPIDGISFQDIQATESRISEILASRVQLGSTSPPSERHVIAQLSDESLENIKERASVNSDGESEALDTSSRAQAGQSHPTSSDNSDSQGGLDDYVSNIRENGEIKATPDSYRGAVAELVHSALGEEREAIENLATPRYREESEPEANNFDSSWGSDIESDDAADDAQDFDEDNELIEKNIARMTDEHIARLFQKQEYLGWDADELQIFDGAEEFDISDKATYNQQGALNLKRHKRRRKAHSRPFSGDPLEDLLQGEDYGDFDVMDRERPSISKGKTQQVNRFLLDLSDSEVAEGLRDAWASDRRKKRQKKKEREELRAQGMLGKNGNDLPDLKAKYTAGMTLAQIEGELRGFLFNGQKDSLSLPPMAKQERKIIHDIANSFGLKSKSQGSNKKRFTILYKTSRTTEFDDVIFTRLKAQLNRRFLPKMDGKNRRGSKSVKGGAPAHTGYRDGEIVGGAAPELGVENRGRAMLEKMGWSSGTALGTLNNQGILTPIEHIVKNSRAGLG